MFASPAGSPPQVARHVGGKRRPETSAWGWPVFVFTLLLYAIGRSRDILLFEIGSLIWRSPASCCSHAAARHSKATMVCALLHAVHAPLPGVVVDTVTMPMKMAVSYVGRTHPLRHWAYPIARTGVIPQIGQYKFAGG